MGLQSFQIDAAEISLEQEINLTSASLASPVSAANLVNAVPGFGSTSTTSIVNQSSAAPTGNPGLANQYNALPFGAEIALQLASKTGPSTAPVTVNQYARFKKIVDASASLYGATSNIVRVPTVGMQIGNLDALDPFITPTSATNGTVNNVGTATTILISGTTLDGAGNLVTSGLVEIYVQAVTGLIVTPTFSTGKAMSGGLVTSAGAGYYGAVQSDATLGTFVVSLATSGENAATLVTLRYAGAVLYTTVTL